MTKRKHRTKAGPHDAHVTMRGKDDSLEALLHDIANNTAESPPLAAAGPEAESTQVVVPVCFDELDRVLAAREKDPFGVLGIPPSPKCVFKNLTKQDIRESKDAVLARLGISEVEGLVEDLGEVPRCKQLERALDRVKGAALALTNALDWHNNELRMGVCRACFRSIWDIVPYPCDPFGSLERRVTNRLPSVINTAALRDFLERGDERNERPPPPAVASEETKLSTYADHAQMLIMGEAYRGQTSTAKSTAKSAKAKRKATSVLATFESRTVSYRYSSLGAALVNAGFVAKSREYPLEVEPFKSPKLVRKIAFRDVGVDTDDSACYPHARLYLLKRSHPRLSSDPKVATCIALSTTYLRHRETILRRISERFLPDTPPVESRDKAKALINALDMDGTIGAWCARNGVPIGWKDSLSRSFPGDVRDDTESRPVHFSLLDYASVQGSTTRAIADALPAMLEYIKRWLHARDDPRVEFPERTLKSYVFQSFEGVSRDAKLCYAKDHCKKYDDIFLPISLQHDGVFFACCVTDEKIERFRQGIEHHCSHTMGYTQPITIK